MYGIAYDGRCRVPQSAEAGDRDEHEPEREAGRVAGTRRSTARDGYRVMRNTFPTRSPHQIHGVMSKRRERSEKRYRRHEKRSGPGAADQSRNRRTTRIRGPSRGTNASP